MHGAVPLVGGGKLHRNRADFQGQMHRFLVNLLLVALFIALPEGIALVTKELLRHSENKRTQSQDPRRRVGVLKKKKKMVEKEKGNDLFFFLFFF